MKRTYNIRLVFGFCFLGMGLSAFAQKDTTKKGGSIDITSSFKPVLRNAAKINFTATQLPADNSTPKLSYNIPAQNLFFSYQPVTLKPLAMEIDTNGPSHNSNYVKAGFGNFSTPYIEAGFSFGDGKKTNVNVLANHISSKGPLPFQQYSQSGFSVNGNFVTNKIEWYGKVGYQQGTYYQYGDTIAKNLSKDQLRNQFQTVKAQAGFKNAFVNSLGISYNPDLKIDIFTDNHKATESNAVLDIPVEKRITQSFGLKLGATANMTQYKPADQKSFSNNLYSINAAFLLTTPDVYLQLGIRPTWNNSIYNTLPELRGEYRVQEEKFVFQAGWLGYYIKNNYQNLATVNPYISQPLTQFNTKVFERYAGFKGSVANHLNYNVKAAVLTYNDMALYKNDSANPRIFKVVRENRLRAFQIHSELGYVVKDQFNLTAGLNYYSFYSIQTEDKPWHLLPIELNAALRFQPVKDVWIKSDLFAWRGAKYQTPDKQDHRLSGALDLNAGVEFKATKMITVFANFNNILNKHYQRWNGYQSLGFNFIGGVIVNFDQNR
ncbi:MAG: hypothetical protein EKK37_01625 [Sphingobacteriales bacterium]|nr:MAG: hypothetical protein EKK37_01625 [Sphingobacteriales bacterium]